MNKDWLKDLDNGDEITYIRMSLYDFKILARWVESAIKHHSAELGDHAQDVEYLECQDKLRTVQQEIQTAWMCNRDSIAQQRKKRKEAWTL